MLQSERKAEFISTFETKSRISQDDSRKICMHLSLKQKIRNFIKDPTLYFTKIRWKEYTLAYVSTGRKTSEYTDTRV
jgi:hypothetical protein